MINFTKMHGLGNDYIYIDRLNGKNEIEEEKIPSFVRYASNRHFGIGADGVIFIDNSKIADYKMSIYNADGTQAEMCGNGIRCFAKYVYDKYISKCNSNCNAKCNPKCNSNCITNKPISIETLAGIKYANLKLEDGGIEIIQICMGKPQILEKAKLKILDKTFEITNISMGNPHAIIYVDNVENFEVEKYGPLLENHKYYPNRTNVEFVQIINRGNIKMRVWERGTGETFACGTGACAAAVASNANGYTRTDVTVLLKGGELKIDWDEISENVFMEGIATKVFEGVIDENNI